MTSSFAASSLKSRCKPVQHVPSPGPGRLIAEPDGSGFAGRPLRSPRQDATIHEGEPLMAISLYSRFVPGCLQLLGGLKTLLQKAEEHATAQKWNTATVLNLRR